METIIDLELLDQGEENPFEKIAVYVERASLEGSISDETKEAILKKILQVERHLQDIGEDKSSKSALILNATLKYAKAVAVLAHQEPTEQASFAIDTSMDVLLETVSVANEETAAEINSKFSTISFIDYLKSKRRKRFTVDELSKAMIITASKHSMIHSSTKLTPKLILNAQGAQIIDEWKIELNFETNTFENHQPLEFIYQFVEILNKIEGVQVILEEIKIGSIKAKLKILFEEVSSKEEVKELLESSKKFAKAKLEKDYVESEKVAAEKDKIEVEKEILKEQLRQDTSIETDYKRALEIRVMEEDLEAKIIDNLRKKMMLLKESKEIFAEMLAEGYLSQKDFEMLIKGIPFLEMKDGKIYLGESPDIIDEM